MKKDKARQVLGRGLGAILEEVEEAYIGNLDDATVVREIALDKIDPNPYQPRKHFDEEALAQLAQSIKEHGLIQPIVVIKKDDRYVLLAGERRLRASKIAKLLTVKAVVADIREQKMRELALIENIQRENLNPIDLAQSLKELIEQYSITHDALADVIKKSRSYITNTLRLLTLDDYVQAKIASSEISYGHAKVLVGLSDKDQKLIADSISGQKLSVRDTETLAANIKKSGYVQPELNLKGVAEQLAALCDCIASAKGNKISLEFKNESSVQKLNEKLRQIC